MTRAVEHGIISFCSDRQFESVFPQSIPPHTKRPRSLCSHADPSVCVGQLVRTHTCKPNARYARNNDNFVMGRELEGTVQSKLSRTNLHSKCDRSICPWTRLGGYQRANVFAQHKMAKEMEKIGHGIAMWFQ